MASVRAQLSSLLRDRVLIAICLLGLIAMAVVTPYDVPWTKWLSENGWHSVARFMDQSAFEGEPFGGGDIATIFIIVAICAYSFTWHVPISKRMVAWRPYFGIILAMGLLYEVGFVHGLKYMAGRARPNVVWADTHAFSAWYEFGNHFITEGRYRGSFPSGHTALAFIVVVPAYLLIADRSHARSTRMAGFALGVAALAYCGLMAACRSMSHSHWVSDCVFSFFSGLVILHLLHRNVLRIPQQVEYYRVHAAHPAAPLVWEFRLTLYLFLMWVGVMCVVFAMRAFWEQPVPWFALLAVPGVPLLVFTGRAASRFHSRVFDSYGQAIERTDSPECGEQAA